MKLKKKYLPHNFIAEKMILSCLLINSKAIETTNKIINHESFYFKNHQELFKVIIFLYNRNQSINFITLISFLQDEGLINKIGGIKVLIDLMNQVPNITYLDEYLRLVKDKFIRRCIIKSSYKAINSSYITNLALENILNEFEDELSHINNEFQPIKYFKLSELVEQIFFEIKTNSKNPKFSGLLSGFLELDKLTQGFQKSDLIIIAGRPAIGKTAFCLSLAMNIIKNSKFPILLFSLEMSKKQILYRLLSMETNINQSILQTGNLSKKDWVKLSRILKILSKLPFFIDDSFNLSVIDIRSKIKTVLSEQNNIGLVVIDYLQLMQIKNMKTINRAQELAIITRSLKNLAREFDIPIIALSQLSRTIEQRNDKKPILSDLRESGSIEQDADLILMLYKNTEILAQKFIPKIILANMIEIIIAKQRNGPTGTVQLYFDKSTTKFQTYDEQI